MRFSDSFLDDIRQRISISDVVGRKVSFDRKKSNPSKGDHWACCPFHSEKTPSFHCENTKGRYYCFGCEASGDHFRFLMETENLSFYEAVQKLAQEAGLQMPTFSKQEQQKEEKKATLYEVMDIAAKFFVDSLQSPDGAKARRWLRDRGVSPATQKQFGIGYAPNDRSALKEFLGGDSQKVEKQKIEDCGLLVTGDDIAVPFDRFRDRVMFPITDTRGRIVAFGGRALSADVPAKYLNSPQTELFSKAHILYNYPSAKKQTKDMGGVIVVEGYMDVVALHNKGIFNAVAPMGTALGDAQLGLAWRAGSEPILCFDGDDAGKRAADRAVDTAIQAVRPGRSVRFLMLPNQMDPDDFVNQEGADSFRELVSAAMPLADMLWARETRGRVFDTPEKRAELEGIIRQVTTQIKDETTRRHYQQDMRQRLFEFFGGANRNKSGFGMSGGGATSKTFTKMRYGNPNQKRLAVSDSLMRSSIVIKKSNIPMLRETTLVMTIINHPQIGLDEEDEFSTLEFRSPIAKEAQSIILDLFANQKAKKEEVRERFQQDDVRETFNKMEQQLKDNRVWQALPDASQEDARQGWRQALALHRRAGVLRDEKVNAERSLAENGDEKSSQRLQNILQELDAVEGTEALIENFGVASGRPVKNF